MLHIGRLLKKTLKGWFHDGAFDKSAALSYCAVFSIAPLLVIITFLVALFHDGDTTEQLRIQFADFVSPQAAELIARGVVNAGFARGRALGHTAFAIFMMIIGASAFTYELQRAVDKMWNVRRQKGKKSAILHRLWTLVFGVGMGTFLQMSVVLNSEASVYRQYVNTLLPAMASVWRWVDNGFSFVLIGVIYCLSYKLLPSTKVAWADAAAAAIVASVLFVLGRWVVALYVFQSSFSSVYGAAGSLMVLLAWLYYCSLVFLFGAKFARVCAEDQRRLA
jgi:membrane protein